MAAYNFNRKIFENPRNETEAAEICSYDCDPIKNRTGNCLTVCSFMCPYNCDSSPPEQSPPQPPPTGGFMFMAPPAKHHHSSLSLTLKISLVILIVIFSFFFLYTLYKFYSVWYRSRSRRSPPSWPENQETHNEFLDQEVVDHPIWYIRTVGLPPSVIQSITVVKYTKTDGLLEGTDCSVCLSDFQDDETLRLLPKCKHAFHISCIDTWLRSHTNCPLCRAGIVKNATSDQNLDDLEDTHVAISITDEVVGEDRPREDNDQGLDLRIAGLDEEEENKGEMVGGSGTNDFLIIRRSVSLNDFSGGRIIRSDVDNIIYYSDRHDVKIQSVNDDSGLKLIKVDQTTNTCSASLEDD